MQREREWERGREFFFSFPFFFSSGLDHLVELGLSHEWPFSNQSFPLNYKRKATENEEKWESKLGLGWCSLFPVSYKLFCLLLRSCNAPAWQKTKNSLSHAQERRVIFQGSCPSVCRRDVRILTVGMASAAHGSFAARGGEKMLFKFVGFLQRFHAGMETHGNVVRCLKMDLHVSTDDWARPHLR